MYSAEQVGEQLFEFAARPSDIAARTSKLLAKRDVWIRRQVDAINFENPRRVLRHSSFDVIQTAPTHDDTSLVARVERLAIAGAHIAVRMPRNQHVALPLMVLRKGTLERFDARDDSGRAVPVLTKAQNEVIGSAILGLAWEAAIENLPRTPDVDHVGTLLRALPGADVDTASTIMHAIFEADESSDWPAVRTARGTPDLREVATMFATSFVLQVVVPKRPGYRQVIKIAYERDVDREAGNFFQTFLMGSSMTMRCDIGQPLRASSHHVEVNACGGLVLSGARVVATDVDIDDGGTPERVLAEGYEGDECQHLTLSPGNAPRDQHGHVAALLTPEIAAIHLPALVLSLVVAVALWLGFFFSWLQNWEPTKDAVVALLLAVPSLAAASISRSRGSAAVTECTRFARNSMYFQSAIGLVAAASVAVDGPTRDETEHAWMVFAIFATGGVMLSLVNVVQTWRTQRLHRAIAIH